MVEKMDDDKYIKQIQRNLIKRFNLKNISFEMGLDFFSPLNGVKYEINLILQDDKKISFDIKDAYSKEELYGQIIYNIHNNPQISRAVKLNQIFSKK